VSLSYPPSRCGASLAIAKPARHRAAREPRAIAMLDCYSWRVTLEDDVLDHVLTPADTTAPTRGERKC
jgi:hypothetical protein